MELKTCIETRRSVRRFKDEPIPRETLEELVRLASHAPSWKNTQTVRWTALTGEKKERFAREAVMGYAGNQAIIGSCPVLLVQTCIQGRAGFERDGSFSTAKGDRWEMFDAGVAAQTLCLAAHDLGLGTVIMGIFEPAKAAEILELPEGRSVSSLIALGWPDQEPVMPKRKSVEELLN